MALSILKVYTLLRMMSEILLSPCTEKIAESFSRSAHNYDREAYVQGECARRLVQFLEKQEALLQAGPFLEIGCGTGFVTKEVLKRFPNREFCITDISETMVAACRQNVAPLSPNVTFGTLDAEAFREKKQYALIISSLVFQWLNHFSRTVFHMLQGLKYGGLLLFSFLETKSFPQWKAVCRDLTLPFTGNALPKVCDLREVTNALPAVTHVWEEDITLVYPNALQCLKSFKRIGANTAMQAQRLEAHEMRRLLQYWDRKCPHGVSITYHVANVAIQRW